MICITLASYLKWISVMYPGHKFENFKTVRSKSLILSLILSTSFYSKTKEL